MERQYPEQFGPPEAQLRRRAEEKRTMPSQEVMMYLLENREAIRQLTARD